MTELRRRPRRKPQVCSCLGSRYDPDCLTGSNAANLWQRAGVVLLYRAWHGHCRSGGSSLGLALGAPAVAWLIERLSWRWSFIITGAVGFVWVVVWFGLVSTPEKTRWLQAESGELPLMVLRPRRHPVRNRLSAGGSEIRTLGPPPPGGPAANSRTAGENPLRGVPARSWGRGRVGIRPRLWSGG